MRNRILFILVVALFFSNAYSQIFGPALQKRLNNASEDEFVRAVIQMKDRVSIDELCALAQGKSKDAARNIVVSRVLNFGQKSQKDLLALLKEFKQKGDVQLLRSTWTTNTITITAKKQVYDSLKQRNDIERVYYETRSVKLCGNTWNITKIGANQVWDNLGVTGEGVFVAIIDGGTDYNHPDLHSNIWNNLGEDHDGDGHTLEWNGSNWVLDPGDLDGADNDNNGYVDDLIGYNFEDNNSNPMDIDSDGHGTHVSGIAAGDGSSGTKTGVAPQAKLICLKTTSGGSSFVSDVVAAIEYAYMKSPSDVINISQGVPSSDTSSYQNARNQFRQVCQAAVTAGIVICAAAGNSLITSDIVPYDIVTPGDVDSVLTVGATTAVDSVAMLTATEDDYPRWRTCFGPVTWSNYPYPPGLPKPDVAAPGMDITSTRRNGGYKEMSGTSMATPAVSGLAALILSVNSSLTPAQVKQILEDTADKVGQFSYTNGRNDYIGYGRVNAYNALIKTIEDYGGTIGGSGKTITFHEGITINSGVTLTILSGTTVNFDAGKKLTVNGKLVANGTSANRITFKATSGTWNGIKFINADNAGSLKYCKIQNTTRAIHIDNSDVTIESNEIANCSEYGIYIYNAEPTIYNNYIHDTDSYAIAANNAGNTFIRKSSIIDCYGGVAVWGSSTIKLRGKSGSSYGLNKIDNWGSGYGVYILGGTPDLGQYSPSSQRGYNDILRDTQYAVYKANSGEVDAEKNYWGGTPQSSWFYGDVNYDFPLSSSQGAGSNLEKSTGLEPDKELLVKGNELADAGKFQEASDIFKSLIDQFPDSRHAGKALAWAMAAENSLDALESQRDYLKKMTEHENADVRGKALLWLQTLEANAGNRKTSEDIVKDVPIDDAIGWEIRLNWANDLLNLYGDSLSAENVFNELQNVYSDVATSEAIQMIRKTARSSEEASLPKPAAPYFSSVLPSDFSISRNYPNPFNPSTTIRFALPKAGKVTMRIFDIRGREIATLVDMEMAAGTHIIAWDGRNLSGINVSSGIYFYRIKFSNRILTGKMILVR